jgi:hypothetical protein
MSVASIHSVRHGCGHSRGVQFSGTPPLRSRGMQKFQYATEDNSSYRHFPSSVTLEIWEKLTPSNGGGLEDGLLGQLGMDVGHQSAQGWSSATDL